MAKKGRHFYISLFSGGGIGDMGFVKGGLHPVLLNEINEDRAAIAKQNFPRTAVIAGDIRKHINLIKTIAQEKLNAKNKSELFMISATPPCQGMSQNGIATILKSIRARKRAETDERNHLFEPAIQLVEYFRPRFFFFENVPQMANTFTVSHEGNRISLVNYITESLDRLAYRGVFKLINTADYGVPQNRTRIAGIFMRVDDLTTTDYNWENLIPPKTHSKDGKDNMSKHITLENAIMGLPPLDSKRLATAHSNYHPLHRVPVSRSKLYEWIRHTEEGKSAFFNNKCPHCGFINADEDIYCRQCKSLLPKPVVQKNGEIRLIKGFTSAYKRMKSGEPAPTITTRSAYACSNHNIHPTQNRVLSLLEIAILQGVDLDRFVCGPNILTVTNGQIRTKKIGATVLRDIFGEAIPSIITFAIASHLQRIVAKSSLLKI